MDDREAIARIVEDIARRWIYQTAHQGPAHLCGGIAGDATTAILAYLGPRLAKEGQVVAPLEPTPAMLDAGYRCEPAPPYGPCSAERAVYCAMISALKDSTNA